jgi:hypothetical protein
MPNRQKNLLEAFQAANDERVGGAPMSAGPFAGDPTSDPTTPPPAGLLPALSLRDARTLMVFVGWGLVCFIAGIAIDRAVAGDGEVRAQDPSVYDAEPLGASSDLGAASLPAAGEEATAALHDTRNVYTIVAVTYENTDAQLALANATYFHFEALGLPVAHPMRWQGQILVLVGAARTQAELTRIHRIVRESPDPDGRPSQYESAYLTRIDSVLPRR